MNIYIQIKRLESAQLRHHAYIVQSMPLEIQNVWQLWHIVYSIPIYYS